MKRPFFDMLSISDAIDQVLEIASASEELRRAIATLTGLVSETSEPAQLDQLDETASHLWSEYARSDTTRLSEQDGLVEAINTAAGCLHDYWMVSAKRRIQMSALSFRSSTAVGIERILCTHSLPAWWFKTCFAKYSAFWLYADDDWTLEHLAESLSSHLPDYWRPWVGLVYSDVVVNHARLRTMLFENYERLMLDTHFFTMFPGDKSLLTERLVSSLTLVPVEDRTAQLRRFLQSAAGPMLMAQIEKVAPQFVRQTLASYHHQN